MVKKGLELIFLAKNTCFGAEFFHSGMGGTSPPKMKIILPKKTLAELGGTQPPLMEKIREVVFCGSPYCYTTKSKVLILQETFLVCSIRRNGKCFAEECYLLAGPYFYKNQQSIRG